MLCFDGDEAGGRAAARAAQTALPALAPDRTIRLATLPSGDDPDTLVRKKGAASFTAVLDAARPLNEALFALLRQPGDFATPEQGTRFLRRLEQAAASIQDKALATAYRSALTTLFFAARRQDGQRKPQEFARSRNFVPRDVRVPPRPIPDGHRTHESRARALAAILLRHPKEIYPSYGNLLASNRDYQLIAVVLLKPAIKCALIASEIGQFYPHSVVVRKSGDESKFAHPMITS